MGKNPAMGVRVMKAGETCETYSSIGRNYANYSLFW